MAAKSAGKAASNCSIVRARTIKRGGPGEAASGTAAEGGGAAWSVHRGGRARNSSI
jgi:hypothetical protein